MVRAAVCSEGQRVTTGLVKAESVEQVEAAGIVSLSKGVSPFVCVCFFVGSLVSEYSLLCIDCKVPSHPEPLTFWHH